MSKDIEKYLECFKKAIDKYILDHQELERRVDIIEKDLEQRFKGGELFDKPEAKKDESAHTKRGELCDCKSFLKGSCPKCDKPTQSVKPPETITISRMAMDAWAEAYMSRTINDDIEMQLFNAYKLTK